MRKDLIALALVSALSAPLAASPVLAAPAPAPQAWDARCYFMRGLLGGALGYSRGMDTLAAKTTAIRCKGYVKPHWRSNEFVATAAANYKIDKLPVILGGHSVGADAVSDAAEKLRRQGVPVTLAFYYDPTSLVQPVPGNVGRAIEFRNNALFQLGQGWIRLSQQFRGTSQIYSKGISHTYLDDDPTVHSTTLCEIKTAIAKSPINICPVVGWTSSLPIISDLLSIVPSMPTAAPTPGVRAPVGDPRLTRSEPGG